MDYITFYGSHFFFLCYYGWFDDLVAFSGTEGNAIGSSRISEFGTFEQSLGFRIEDAVDLSRSMWLKFNL